MDQNLKDQFARAIHAAIQSAIRRNPRIDPIDLSERVSDAVELIHDMHSEEAGISSVPRDLQRDAAPQEDPDARQPWDIRANPPTRVAPPPPAREAVVPVGALSRRKSPLVLPGDPDFVKPADLGKKIQPASRILRPGSAPRKPVPQKPVWDEGDLIQRILEATQPKIQFETADREGRPVLLTVDRNVHNQAGMGNVLLTYKHPAINDQPSDASTIIPMAKVSFSIFDAEINIDNAIDGPNGIMQQLRGMYRAKPESMEPQAGMEPGPLRLDMRTQPGEHHNEQFQPGVGKVADPFERNNEILANVMRRERGENDALAPQGHRFKA